MGVQFLCVMSASEEWNKKIAAMKEAREKKRAGISGSPRSTSPLTKAASTPTLETPSSPANNANANAARELNLVKAELKILQMKYDSEVKKRESLEKQLEAQKQSTKASASEPKPSGPTRNSMTTNKSVRQSVAPQVNIVQVITKVLDEMQRLENNIKRADSQRNRAETELLEVAMLKQTADETLDNLITDLGQKVVAMATLCENLRTISSNVPEAAAQISPVCDSLEAIRKDMILRMDTKTISKDKDQAFKRASVFAQKLSTPPPPAPVIGPPKIGPPSPAGPTRAIGGVRNAGPRESTLLTQIRRGQNLKQIDTEAIARERQQNRNNCRQSMALLSSLKDTLRAALTVRQEDMNLYGEDDDAWDD